MESDEVYGALIAADEEVCRLLQEMDDFIKSQLSDGLNRAEAERLALKKYASLIDGAMLKSRKALDDWCAEVLDDLCVMISKIKMPTL